MTLQYSTVRDGCLQPRLSVEGGTSECEGLSPPGHRAREGSKEKGGDAKVRPAGVRACLRPCYRVRGGPKETEATRRPDRKDEGKGMGSQPCMAPQGRNRIDREGIA